MFPWYLIFTVQRIFVFSYPRIPRDPRVPGFWSPKGTSGRYVSNLFFRKGTRVLMSVQGSFCQIRVFCCSAWSDFNSLQGISCFPVSFGCRETRLSEEWVA
jgi:hypothetical protein